MTRELTRRQLPTQANHEAGRVPDRHEIDSARKLNDPAIARAIADTGFRGYFADEFIPTRDPMTSLGEAVTSSAV